jgi:hypothetical protein
MSKWLWLSNGVDPVLVNVGRVNLEVLACALSQIFAKLITLTALTSVLSELYEEPGRGMSLCGGWALG